MLEVGALCFMLPITLVIVGSGMYIEINDSTLKTRTLFIVGRSIPVKSIRRIYEWKPFILGADKAIAIESQTDGKVQHISLTGIFTPPEVSKNIVEHLIKVNPHIVLETMSASGSGKREQSSK
jgi:hypothetical protein